MLNRIDHCKCILSIIPALYMFLSKNLELYAHIMSKLHMLLVGIVNSE